MTSTLISSIHISDRQRDDLGDIDDLALHISKRGLLQSIVIDRENRLVIGGRRLAACTKLGWTNIDTNYTDEIDPRWLQIMELGENIKRKDLTWQEQHAAIIKIHNLCLEYDSSWTQEKTANEIGVTRASITNHFAVEKVKDHPLIKKADSFSTARNTATRILERARHDELNVHVPTIDICTSSSPVIVADFNDWAPAYDGSKFNLIHCDFPYGINSHKSEGMDSAIKVEYEDTPEIYWQLCHALYANLDRFCAASAHIIFWFSPNLYCQTWEMLKLLDGFVFEEHPLVWLRGNEGIAPDPQRRPRRTYDMAFFGWRGDRKIVRVKANSFSAPTTRVDHPHEKSQAMLEHFFEMCVDPQTRLLDPTCGSGSALRAANKLGADHVLGLERDEQFVADATRAFEKTRSDRRLAEAVNATREVS